MSKLTKDTLRNDQRYDSKKTSGLTEILMDIHQGELTQEDERIGNIRVSSVLW